MSHNLPGLGSFEAAFACHTACDTCARHSYIILCMQEKTKMAAMHSWAVQQAEDCKTKRVKTVEVIIMRQKEVMMHGILGPFSLSRGSHIAMTELLRETFCHNKLSSFALLCMQVQLTRADVVLTQFSEQLYMSS